MHVLSLAVERIVLAAAQGADDGTLITVLLSLLGAAVALAGTVILPRMLGQLVPATKVDEAVAAVRAQLIPERDKALAEAATWKEAFAGMQKAHDGVLDLNRSLTQAALITSTVMTTLKNAASTGGD